MNVLDSNKFVHENSVHLMRVSPKKAHNSRKSSQLSDSYSRDIFSHQIFGSNSFDMKDSVVHGVPQGLVQARSKEFERIAQLAASVEDCSLHFENRRERRNSTTTSTTDRNYVMRHPSQASANQNHYHEVNVSVNNISGRNISSNNINNNINKIAAYTRPKHVL